MSNRDVIKPEVADDRDPLIDGTVQAEARPPQHLRTATRRPRSHFVVVASDKGRKVDRGIEYSFSHPTCQASPVGV